MKAYKYRVMRKFDDKDYIVIEEGKMLAESMNDLWDKFPSLPQVTMRELYNRSLHNTELQETLSFYHIGCGNMKWMDKWYWDRPSFFYRRWNPKVYTMIEFTETTLTVEELLQQDAEKAIKFCAERGLSVIPMK